MADKNKHHLAIAIRAINTLAVSAATLALAPSALAQEQKVLEEVVVQGIRYSLEEAADRKRADGRVVDVIVAEDIGKLPDNNIAEALQRITGVTINRDFGVGSEVSIRGLKENRVEVNGRSTMGDGRNGINFEDFPAGFLSAVEVVKSPTPEMVEGALGGTISLKTARPLDLKDTVMAATYDMEYADKADNWAPKINIAAGDSWDFGDAGVFGAMAMFSYQDRTLRQDSYETSLFVYDHTQIANLDQPAQNTPSGDYVVAAEHKFEPYTEERERTAYNVTLQWAPASEKGNFYLDVNATERDGNQEAYSILYASGTPVATADTYEDANGALNNYRMEGVVAIPKTWSSFRSTEAFTNAFGGEWNFTDKLKVSGEFSRAESKTFEPASEFNWRSVDAAAEALNPSAANELKSDLTIVNSNSKPGSVVFDDGDIFAQTENFAFREYRYIDERVNNEETAFKFDVEYAEPFDLEWVTAVKTGIRHTENDYERTQSELRLKDIYKNLKDANGDPAIIWMDEIAAAFPGSIITPGVGSDAFDHTGIAGSNALTNFTVYDAGRLKNVNETFRMVQQLLAGSNYNTPGNSDGYISTNGSVADDLVESKGSYALIGEETSAFYLQANLDFERWHVIVGGRYVETDITSTAYNQDGTSLVVEKQSYDDLLPSVNVAYDLMDDTIVRFAAAKVMRRADYNELSPTYIFNSDRITATKGNPALEPYRATQYDIAIEHYFGTGNMVSAALFYKDIASFLKETSRCDYVPDAMATQNQSIYENICIKDFDNRFANTSDYTFASSQAEFDTAVAESRNGILTTLPSNGESGKVQGLELGYQQAFDFLPGLWSGFGVNANYTYADSEDPDGVALEDISKNTYNAQLYWEHSGFGMRLAYTYRDEFLDDIYQKRTERVGTQVGYNDGVSDPTAGNSYRDELSQLDFSANWDVNDNIGLVFNVTNLTAEPTVNRSVTGTVWQVQENDRRFTLGLRAKL